MSATCLCRSVVVSMNIFLSVSFCLRVDFRSVVCPSVVAQRLKDLPADTEEKDLGVKFHSSMKFESHISSVVNKTNQLIGLIKRSFSFMDKELFLKLYKTLVRTHTDYGNSIWYPVTKKNKQAIENLQRRATKIVPEIKDLSYEERLR